MTNHRLGDLAEAVGGELVGDADRRIEGVRSLEQAGPRDLSFLTDSRYRKKALESKAGALLLGESERLLETDADTIFCQQPQQALIAILGMLYPRPERPPGIHPTAVVGEGSVVASSAHVGPYAVIGEGSTVGEGAMIDAFVAVGPGCRIGAGVVLHSHVVLYDSVEIGDRSMVHSGTVIGADGFGFTPGGGAQIKVPQVGRVVIEEDVEVGANSAIDRATLEVTRIGRGTKIDNLVQVGHNVVLGRGCVLCAQSGISGSTVVGDRVVFAGQTGAADHLQIGSGVQVAAKASVLRSVESGAVGGTPAIPLRDWQRQAAVSAKLPELRRRVARLERRLSEIEDQGTARPDGGKAQS